MEISDLNFNDFFLMIWLKYMRVGEIVSAFDDINGKQF